MKINKHYQSSRREFLKNSAKGSALFFLHQDIGKESHKKDGPIPLPDKLTSLQNYVKPLDLSPASWIWFPSERTLPNTVFLFRKSILINKPVASARGWILGESRYRFYVNDEYLQFGPAPSDPRFSEADLIELSEHLVMGENILGSEVLFYGYGDGTWPIGKPGFIFKLEISYTDGTNSTIVSDNSWLCKTAISWPPGQFKRWYLRAFQEDFDARLYPYRWAGPEFAPEQDWTPAMDLGNPSNLPAICSDYSEYMYEIQGQRDACELRERSIPPLRETDVRARQLSESMVIRWLKPAEEYFQMVTPGAYEITGGLQVEKRDDSQWSFNTHPDFAAILTFEFEEQVVGFPYFTIEAPEGTIIEMMVQEGHAINTDTPVMNNHFHSWSRFTCREGTNVFKTFDYESLRWLQLHVRNTSGRIILSQVGIKRRLYDWPNQPVIKVSDDRIQKVMDASLNTIHNAAQETIVDGMGRERQQYSGDVGHQLHAIFYAFGETRLPARYLNTFSQGLTHDGYFLDSWPAYDRLARLMERQLNLTPWGPILDHSIGFNFDCYHYYLYTGDLAALKEVYPRLLVFRNYLKHMADPDTNLLPVEDIGVPYVWIDNDAYRQQKHKQCAFNLYAAAMLKNGLAPLCRALDDDINYQEALQLGEKLHKAVIKYFWDDRKQELVINKPWLNTEKEPRYCDRSLATAVMYDLIPSKGMKKAVDILAANPEEMGLSYPANAGWRYWALARGGRMDVVIGEIREKWASLDSVILNNTLQEAWSVQPDSSGQWSHCPVAPLYMLYMGIAGLSPLKPAFEEVMIWPQMEDINQIELVARTVQGEIFFKSAGEKGNRQLSIRLPVAMTGQLKLHKKEKTALEKLPGDDKDFSCYRLTGGKQISLTLKYT